MADSEGEGAEQRIHEEPPTVNITTKQMESKFSTKKEIYNFLTVDCCFYLPECKCVTTYFLKAVMRNREKKGKYIQFLPMDGNPIGVHRFFSFMAVTDIHLLLALSSDKVAHLAIPHYETLTIEQMFIFLEGHNEVYVYFPEHPDTLKLPRQWIANVAYTLLGDTFRTWVQGRIAERNAKVIEKQDLFIHVDPKIA